MVAISVTMSVESRFYKGNRRMNHENYFRREMKILKFELSSIDVIATTINRNVSSIKQSAQIFNGGKWLEKHINCCQSAELYTNRKTLTDCISKEENRKNKMKKFVTKFEKNS